MFEEEILRRHRELKTHLLAYCLGARPLVILTAPVIYAVIVPLVLLDLFVILYQAVCFPVYGIARVRRADYLVFDRHHLAYLNALEKLNCAYCSYANGLIAYVREIAGPAMSATRGVDYAAADGPYTGSSCTTEPCSFKTETRRSRRVPGVRKAAAYSFENWMASDTNLNSRPTLSRTGTPSRTSK